MRKKFKLEYTKSYISNFIKWVILNNRKTNLGKKLKSDVFKAFLVMTRQFQGHFGIFCEFFVTKKNLQFPFYNKSYKTKNVHRYSIDKIFFLNFCNIFKICKIRAIFANFDVLLCKLNGHYRKIPDIFFQFLF